MDSITNVNDLFALIPAAEIRTLREECPSNLATLCYKVCKNILSTAIARLKMLNYKYLKAYR